ncbi:NAD(P)/FAD-dependent oxidoreductase [Abyssalbus ytuae]|uniref:NAD(P)/FAD-dependent oxidoreductase n=1 Tax=Abyssalbus ytuae TaxID=2926907 RepID=A0A9E7A0P8_9FLAO|nr:NAD(P)/FAD-dependent oxidoreductase [Abyssalbus ytuae]UOB18787.1 NAD(P)/FAD-dependent oxidoreductase [Abyssalbus ytuae]
MDYDVLIVGGGAAGFFAAIHIAQFNPGYKIAILERGKEVLTKVRISGGGRCNVTHAEFIPNELAKNYPRGEKELKGPFHTFCSGDTMEFFQKRGVELKIEEDGRIFPVSDSSQTIIDCFLSETKKLGVNVLKNSSVKNIFKEYDKWIVETDKIKYTAQKILIATGSNPKIWNLMGKLGHTIVAPVPSLFTFNIKDERIKNLAGISTMATVSILNSKLKSSGPLLITHWGMSGPAILKLSAWGAREFFAQQYEFKIQVNWLHNLNQAETLETLKEFRLISPKKMVVNTKPYPVPNRLWLKLTAASGITDFENWGDVSNIKIEKLALELTQGIFPVKGKSTFKEEFVTAGGIKLKEVNFKTFESKLHPNLYFAGEVLNIDAITGGFNFQNAWTSAYIASKALAFQGL